MTDGGQIWDVRPLQVRSLHCTLPLPFESPPPPPPPHLPSPFCLHHVQRPLLLLPPSFPLFSSLSTHLSPWVFLPYAGVFSWLETPALYLSLVLKMGVVR
uniref:Uncharacterized protein n=1 Tax=Fagus sylvatica TaxID=28930 RepID=A0A2N9FJ37_FAGSY